MGQGGEPSGNSPRSRVRRPRRPRGSHPVHGSGRGARARGWGGRVGWVAGEHDPVNAPSLAQPRRTGTERGPACCSPHRSHPLPSSRPFRWTTRPGRGPRGVGREHGPLFIPAIGRCPRGGGVRAGRGARSPGEPSRWSPVRPPGRRLTVGGMARGRVPLNPPPRIGTPRGAGLPRGAYRRRDGPRGFPRIPVVGHPSPVAPLRYSPPEPPSRSQGRGSATLSVRGPPPGPLLPRGGHRLRAAHAQSIARRTTRQRLH